MSVAWHELWRLVQLSSSALLTLCIWQQLIDGGADEVTIALIGLGYRAAQEGDGLVFHRKGPARRKAAAQDGAKQNEAPEGASEGATAERAAAAGQEVPGRSKQGKKGPRRGKPPKGKAQQAGSQQGRNPKGKPHHGGRGRKPQEKQPDPNSPFAVLKELKFGG